MKPRTKGKLHSDYGMPEYYSYYRRLTNIKKFKSVFTESINLRVDRSLYAKVINAFHEKLAKRVLEGNIVQLPNNFGRLSIVKTKMKFNAKNLLRLNFKEYNKGNKVFHLNENRNHYRYRWYWSMFKINIPGKFYYRFKACRTNTRGLAKILKETDKDYRELIRNNKVYID